MKIKGFSLGRVISRRDQIFTHALQPHIGSQIVANAIQDVADAVMHYLPATASRDALFESIRLIAGTPLTRTLAKELAWRLAGNVDLLIEGQPVRPWVRQLKDEAVPVRVERMRLAHKRDKQGWTLFCRALAGTPCPTMFPQFFSKRSCYVISRAIGFTGNYVFSTPLHFVGLVFVANIEAEKSHETPYFQTISNTSGLLAQNRSKIEVRCRVKPCPRGFTHACDKCWLGYNECPAAVHPQTLVQRDCTGCESAAFFEPDDVGPLCINCRYAQRHHQ
jgi:hypothetical protein